MSGSERAFPECRTKEKLSCFENKTEQERFNLKSIIEFFEQKLLPKTLISGCSPHKFWQEELCLLSIYFKSYEIKLKEVAKELKEKVNASSWLHGVHIQSAVASLLCKNAPYPQKPFDLFGADIPKDLRIQSNEETIKKRSKQIDEILAKNKQSSIKFSVKIEIEGQIQKSLLNFWNILLYSVANRIKAVEDGSPLP